jgi:proteasome beta subunit
MRRDSASGDGIDLVKITPEEYVQFEPKQIDEIIQKISKR